MCQQSFQFLHIPIPWYSNSKVDVCVLKFAVDLVEVCHRNNCNVGLLCYSPLGGGALTGKYLDPESEASKKGRLQLFPGYMERYNKSIAKVFFLITLTILSLPITSNVLLTCRNYLIAL